MFKGSLNAVKVFLISNGFEWIDIAFFMLLTNEHVISNITQNGRTSKQSKIAQKTRKIANLQQTFFIFYLLEKENVMFKMI